MISLSAEGGEIHVSRKSRQPRRTAPHVAHNLVLVFRLYKRYMVKLEDEIGPPRTRLVGEKPTLVRRIYSLKIDAGLLFQLSKSCLQRLLPRATMTLRKRPLLTLPTLNHQEVAIWRDHDCSIDLRVYTMGSWYVTLESFRKHHLRSN